MPKSNLMPFWGERGYWVSGLETLNPKPELGAMDPKPLRTL